MKVYRLKIKYKYDAFVDDYVLGKVDTDNYMLFCIYNMNRHTEKKAKTLDELIDHKFEIVKEWNSLREYYNECNK